jgi:hypothetical protein
VGLSSKDAKKLNKASVLSTSKDPKDWDSARARQVDVDYKDLVRQLKAKRRKKMKEDWQPEITHSKMGDATKKAAEKKRKKAEDSLPPHLKLDVMKKAFAHTNEQNELAGKFKIDTSAHKKVQKKAKMRNLAKGNTNPNEKAAAEKKAGGPKLIGERLGGKGYKRRKDYAGRTVEGDWPDSDRGAGNKATRKAGGKVKKKSPTYQAYVLNKEEDNFSQKDKELKKTKSARNQRYNTLHSGTNTSKNTDVNEGKTFDQWKKAAAKALGRKEKERKAQPATDAGARARRKLKDKEHNKYVNFLPAEDD